MNYSKKKACVHYLDQGWPRGPLAQRPLQMYGPPSQMPTQRSAQGEICSR